jgi:hypothetical protein
MVAVGTAVIAALQPMTLAYLRRDERRART